uniref:Uncharacterized protein n=1 Tax=Pristionchus pacificus TaxID=54126 RepID=A0A2A6B3Z3_PRIPA|eukprot:PDM60578.1 hypothetical protein PRIPAC_53556 [Pristionchus pacificus]
MDSLASDSTRECRSLASAKGEMTRETIFEFNAKKYFIYHCAAIAAAAKEAELLLLLLKKECSQGSQKKLQQRSLLSTLVGSDADSLERRMMPDHYT